MDSDSTQKERGDKTILETDARTLIEADRTIKENKSSTDHRPQLSSFRGFRICEEFPATGGEADIFLIGEGDATQRILKLYRYGMNPREDILKKAKELSDKFPQHIVTIYDCGHDEETGRWYEIQEYAKYGDLKEIVDFKLNKKILYRAISDIIEGLRVLHDNNILHLDLKPSNILIRSIKPLDLIFTDFGIASILDPELSKKMTAVKGTPLYWSPEAFTGVVGKGADYWSLGMIVLELLLGKHPFGGLDTKVIMYTLSTKGVSIPDDLSEEYTLLLKGLLTREPQGRWGYDEVKRWLGGDTNIPIYYVSEIRKDAQYAKAYRFVNGEYHSLVELLSAFVESEQAWEYGKQHLFRGYVTRWLENNEDYETGVRIEEMKNLSDDADMAVIRVVNTFNKKLPFILYGKLITVKNLFIFAAKAVRGETTGYEDSVVKCLTNGKLFEYYGEYLAISSRDKDDLHAVLMLISKVTSQRAEYLDKLKDAFRVLDFFLNPHSFLLPADMQANPHHNPDLIIEHLAALMKKDEFADLTEKFILPDNLIEDLNKGMEGGIEEYLMGTGRLREREGKNLLLSKAEHEHINKEYILPEWLNGQLTGKSISGHCEAVDLLRSMQEKGHLIRTADFMTYIKKNPSCSSYIERTMRAGTADTVFNGRHPEERWVGNLKALSKDAYLKLAGYVKNNVIISMFSQLERMAKELSVNVSESSPFILGYLTALKSSDVRWDESDKVILNDIHSTCCNRTGKTGLAGRMLERAAGKETVRIGLAFLTGVNMDGEKTLKAPWALAGGIIGSIVGVLFGAVIKILVIETNVSGMLMLGAILGAIRRSSILGLLAALIGLVSELFFGYALYVEIAEIVIMGTIGGASLGALIGTKKEMLSPEERIYHQYYARISDVLADMEAVQNGK
ncbi:MAG: protein kinase domain-containing protein [Thermodesulfovibrionales bacterium]